MIKKPIWPATASSLRPRAITKVAPRTPKIAPEAPALTVSGLNQRATNEPATQADEVDDDEAQRADRRLQQPPHEVEQQHVEADVGDADVDEAAGEDPPPVAAFVDRGAPRAPIS